MGKIHTLVGKQVGDVVPMKHLNREHLPDFAGCKIPEHGILLNDSGGVRLLFVAVRDDGKSKIFYEKFCPSKDKWVVRHG